MAGRDGLRGGGDRRPPAPVRPHRLLGDGRDQRFADTGLVVTGCPSRCCPRLCAAYAGRAEASLRDALCGARAQPSPAREPNQLPPVLALKIERARRAFVLPLQDAESRVAALRRQAQDGSEALRNNADQVAAVEAEIAPYVERFRIVAGAAGGPAPLRCASEWTAAALAARPVGAGFVAEADPAGASARANAVLLLAAALDGRTATGASPPSRACRRHLSPSAARERSMPSPAAPR